MADYKYRYGYLKAKKYIIHDEQTLLLDDSLLQGMKPFAPLEFYDRERMIEISGNDAAQDEINRLIKDLLEYRRESYPKDSNREAMCMEQLTEFLSKLDTTDFRKINIEGLLTAPAEKTLEEKNQDLKRRQASITQLQALRSEGKE